MRKLISTITIVFMAITVQAQLAVQPDLSKNALWMVTEECILDRYGLACVELPAETPMNPNDEVRIYCFSKLFHYVRVFNEDTLFVIDEFGNDIVSETEAIQAVYGTRIASTIKDTTWAFDVKTKEIQMFIEDKEIMESDGIIQEYEIKDDYFFDNQDGWFKYRGFKNTTISKLNVLKMVDGKYYIVGL